MRSKHPLIASILLLLTLVRVEAGIAYSNLGPNDSFGEYGVDSVAGPESGFGSQTVADQFTAAFTGMITTVEMAIVRIDGPANIDISILLNDPATSLPQVNSRVSVGIVSAYPDQLVTLTLALPYFLSAGDAYWLELAPHDTTTAAGWYTANDAHATLAATSLDSGATYRKFGPAEAFRIRAIPIQVVSVIHQTNNHILLQCVGVPNKINRIEALTDLNPGGFSTVASVAADGAGSFLWEDPNLDNLTTRFYRLAYP